MDKRFIDIKQPPFVSSKIKFDHFIFDILTHVTVYNILQVKKNGACIALCRVSGRKTTGSDFVYESNHNMLVCDNEDIYCGFFFDNRKHAPIIFFEK